MGCESSNQTASAQPRENATNNTKKDPLKTSRSDAVPKDNKLSQSKNLARGPPPSSAPKRHEQTKSNLRTSRTGKQDEKTSLRNSTQSLGKPHKNIETSPSKKKLSNNRQIPQENEPIRKSKRSVSKADQKKLNEFMKIYGL